MAATTWNPSQSSANNTLSNGNLTVTIVASDSTNGATFSTNGVTSGKYYWEVQPSGSGFSATASLVGIGNTSSVTNNWIGSFPNTLGIEFDGIVWNNFTSIATFANHYNMSSDRVCFALDLNNHKIWININALGWNSDVIGNQNPATNTGGLTIPSAVYAAPVVAACNTFNNTPTPDSVIAYFSSADWLFTVPSGFVSLDAAPPLPPAASPDVWLYPIV